MGVTGGAGWLAFMDYFGCRYCGPIKLGRWTAEGGWPHISYRSIFLFYLFAAAAAV
jgi:hypothetical protein